MNKRGGTAQCSAGRFPEGETGPGNSRPNRREAAIKPRRNASEGPEVTRNFPKWPEPAIFRHYLRRTPYRTRSPRHLYQCQIQKRKNSVIDRDKGITVEC